MVRIIEICESNKIDYHKISEGVVRKIRYEENKYDINLIIPARGRKNFLSPVVSSILSAKEQTTNKIQITLFEYSDTMEHDETCEQLGINYLYLDSAGSEFNKCLCHNLAAILTNTSEWLIFHDLDCMVQKDFFTNLMLNITKEDNAIQTYNNRRLIYLGESISKKIISGDVDINNITNTHLDTKTGTVGAPGGSIATRTKTFFDVGGFDPELFYSYAPEDAFFWVKVLCLTEIKRCENPPNEVFHLFHPPQHKTNPKFDTMLQYLHFFMDGNDEEKLKFIEFKKTLIPNQK